MFDMDTEEEIIAVIRSAHAYRKADQDGTPRLWRGKTLQDLAASLDDALEACIERYGNEILSP